jgi:hypothetical protein
MPAVHLPVTQLRRARPPARPPPPLATDTTGSARGLRYGRGARRTARRNGAGVTEKRKSRRRGSQRAPCGCRALVRREASADVQPRDRAFVTCGDAAHAAVVAATRTAARALGLGDHVGTIEPGKIADLVVVDGDPLQRVGILRDRRRIWLVLRRAAPVTGTTTEPTLIHDLDPPSALRRDGRTAGRQHPLPRHCRPHSLDDQRTRRRSWSPRTRTPRRQGDTPRQPRDRPRGPAAWTPSRPSPDAPQRPGRPTHVSLDP